MYSHRSTLLHSLVVGMPDALGLARADTLLPVVPMFHVNAWGLPFTAAMVGAKLVLPGPFLDAASLLDLMASERVTVAAGVPTIWIGIRDALDSVAGQARWKLKPGVRMIVGGSAVPEQLIRDFDRLGLKLLHAWGMTETSPVGLVSTVPPDVTASRARRRRQRTIAIPREGRASRRRSSARARAATGGTATSRAMTVHDRRGPDPRAVDRRELRRRAHAGSLDRGWLLPHGRCRPHVPEHGYDPALVDRVADMIKSGLASGSRPRSSRTRRY